MGEKEKEKREERDASWIGLNTLNFSEAQNSNERDEKSSQRTRRRQKMMMRGGGVLFSRCCRRGWCVLRPLNGVCSSSLSSSSRKKVSSSIQNATTIQTRGRILASTTRCCSSSSSSSSSKARNNGWAQTASEAIPDPQTLLNYRCASNLSTQQANAVLSPNPSFVRVLAGPGSGKTHVLVSRVQHLIEDENVSPENILCITFTNKAAKELRNRLEKTMGADVSRAITAGTFHAVAARILRKHVEKVHEALERTADFTIYDSDDSKAVVRDILVEKLGQTKKSAAPLPMKNFISMRMSNTIQNTMNYLMFIKPNIRFCI